MTATQDVKARMKEALELHRSGRTEAAVGVLEALVREHADASRAWFLLGFLAQGLGRLGLARQAYDRTLAVEPDFVEARLNLAQLLRQTGDPGAAVEQLRAVLADRPENPGALNNLGLALHDIGRTDEAEAAFRQAVALAPQLGQAWNNLGNLLDRAGRHAEARRAFEDGIRQAPDFVALRVSLGRLLREAGRLRPAEDQLREALRRAPEAALPRAGLAELLLVTERWSEADEHLARALALAPDDPALRRRLAAALFDAGRVERAVELLEAAGAERGTGPAATESRLLHADCLERLNRIEEARGLLEQVPHEDRANSRHALVAARIAERDGRPEDARGLLEAQLAREQAEDRRRNLQYELGRMRDLSGDADGAMAVLGEANASARRVWDAGGGDARGLLDRIRATRDALQRGAIPADWTELPEPEPLPFSPVFLVGFPRSGTTLLDRVLAAHPRLKVVEERPTLSPVNERLQAAGSGDLLAALAGLDAGERTTLRRMYVDRLSREGYGDSAVVVDKHPLRAWHLPTLHRLFPEARFIVGLRHPCDAVLSCYMQAFHFSPAMAQFHTLADGARFYDLVIGTLCESLDRLPLAYRQVRYEDLVEDLETEARATLEFLDLEWDPAILDFHRSAQDQRRINNPSYNQVSRPIYRQARYRWERYREHLEPVLPLLAPYRERFGYV